MRYTTIATAIVLLLGACSRSDVTPAPGEAAPQTAAPTSPAPAPSPTTQTSSSASTSPSPAAEPRGLAQTKVDRTDPAAVAEAYLRTVWSWDTDVDNSPDGAAQRATQFAAGDLAASLAGETTRSSTASFAAATAAGGGYTKVTSIYPITGDGSSGDGHRQELSFEVVAQVLDAKGRALTSEPESAISNLTLERQSKGGWAVVRDEAA